MSDLAAMFRKDPLNLTKDDITVIVMGFRGMRHQFKAGNMKAGSTKEKTKAEKKREEDVKAVGDLDIGNVLDDLL